MKVIANLMEPMGIELGVFSRAVRPVTGFGFEQLFSGSDGVISEGSITVDVFLPAPLDADGPVLPELGQLYGEARQSLPGLETVMVQFDDVLEEQAELPPAGAVAVKPDDALIDATDVQSVDPSSLAAIPLEELVAMRIPVLGASAYAKTAVGSNPLEAEQAVLVGADRDAAQSVRVKTNLVTGGGRASPSLPLLLATAQPQTYPSVKLPISAMAADVPQPPFAMKEAQPALATVPAPVLTDLAEEGANRSLFVKQPVLPVTRRVEAGMGPLVPAPDILTEAAAKATTVLVSPVAAQLAKAAAQDIQPAVSRDYPDVASMNSGASPTETAENTKAAGLTPRSTALAALASPVAARVANVAIQNGKASGQVSSGAGKDLAARNDAQRFDPAQAIVGQGEPHAPGSSALRAPLMTSTPAPVAPSALPMTSILKLREADWHKSLVAQIERMTAAGSKHIEISLRPKNLGEIQVSLDLRGDHTHVHIATETAAVARLFGAAEDRLAQMLDQSGYRLSGFSAQDQGIGGERGQNGGQHGQHAPRHNRPTMDSTPREEPKDVSAAGPISVDRGQAIGINMLA